MRQAVFLHFFALSQFARARVLVQSLLDVWYNALRVSFINRQLSAKLLVMFHVVIGLSVFIPMWCSWVPVTMKCSWASITMRCSWAPVTMRCSWASITMRCSWGSFTMRFSWAPVKIFNFSLPNNRTNSTIARKSHFLISPLRFDFRTFRSLWQADHTSDFQSKKSLPELCIHTPRYLKLPTVFIAEPFLARTGAGLTWFSAWFQSFLH